MWKKAMENGGLLVGSRESGEPLNIVESWFDPENDLGGSKNATADKKVGCKSKKNKETIEQFTYFNKIFYW